MISQDEHLLLNYVFRFDQLKRSEVEKSHGENLVRICL